MSLCRETFDSLGVFQVRNNYLFKKFNRFLCVWPMIFCERNRKRRSKRILGQTSFGFLCIISWIDKTFPVQLTAKAAVFWHLSSTPFMGMFFVPLKLNVYFPTWEFDLCQWSKMGRYRVQKPILICFSEKWIFLRLKTGGVIWSTFPAVPLRLLHVRFPNTALAHLSFNTRSPPYSFKIFGLFAVTTPVAIIGTWHLLMTLPAILVPSAVSLAFFSIPESNKLSLPILLKTVQSPSLHFFFQRGSDKRMFQTFSSKLFNCWSSVKPSCIQPNSFLNLRRNFDLVFFRALVCLLNLLFSISKLRRSNIFCYWS